MRRNCSYYIEELLRQPSAATARKYLGLGSDDAVTFGYVTQNTPLWNDIRIPMTSMRVGASGITFTNFRGTIRAALFTNAPPAAADMEFEIQLPHGFNEDHSLGIRLHLHWSSNPATGANTVQWNVETSVADLNGVFTTPTITYSAIGQTQQAYQHIFTPIHTFTGLHESAVILGRIYRGGVGDTFGNNVWGLSLDAHYAFRSAGSLLETGD